MMSLPLRIAIGAVRAWSRVYTRGLPPELREVRRQEIDSDVWESVNDGGADRRLLPLHLAARLIIGIPDDLGWRSDHLPSASAWRWRIAVTALVVTTFGLWLVGRGAMSARLPDLPKSLLVSAHDVRLTDAPPPPPPPPPCLPRGYPQLPRCTR
jgi:hypothetical protein